MKLHINSGSHAPPDKAERIEDSRDALDSPGVVFTEDPVEEPDLLLVMFATVIAPLLVITLTLWRTVMLPILRFFLGSDTNIENYFAREFDSEIIAVDASRLGLICKEWDLWSRSNWLIIIMPLILVQDWLYSSWRSISILYFFLGFSLLFAFLAGLQSTRDHHMAVEIAEKADNFSEGILICGGKHHEPIAKILAHFDGVEVLNPVPETDEQ